MMFTNKHKYLGLLYIEMYYYTYYTYTLKKSISKHIETKCTPPSPSKKKRRKKENYLFRLLTYSYEQIFNLNIDYGCLVIDNDIFLDYRPIKLQNPSSQGKAGCSSKSNKITCTKDVRYREELQVPQCIATRRIIKQTWLRPRNINVFYSDFIFLPLLLLRNVSIRTKRSRLKYYLVNA